MTFLDSLNKTSKLLDDFEKNILLPKNNKKILEYVELISKDIDKYNAKENSDYTNISENFDKTEIKKVIDKIDHLYKLILPQLKLNENFSTFNIEK